MDSRKNTKLFFKASNRVHKSMTANEIYDLLENGTDNDKNTLRSQLRTSLSKFPG